MAIKKVKIINFKNFKGDFSIDFEKGINILVGNNGVGKTTILEAINLALTGMYNNKNIRTEISQYLFNKEVVDEYLQSDKECKKNVENLPKIIIEIYFDEGVLSKDEFSEFEGDGSSNGDASGIRFSIEFDERYSNEYVNLCEEDSIFSLPLEYYEAKCVSFARDNVTPKSLPVKCGMIDNSNNYSNVSVSRILRNSLEEEDSIKMAQSFRKSKEMYSKENNICVINTKIKENVQNNLTVSVNLGTKNSWENDFIMDLDGIPYDHIGKGKQNIIKTKLALMKEDAKNKNIILIEEPEAHLSYSNLNILLEEINKENLDKQIIITTHSSFVCNKLGLSQLILLNANKSIRFKDLSMDTNKYFKKVSGYDTLRLLLSKKVILVEGPSDELIVQRAFKDKIRDIPINKGVDVISVGTAFLRFLEIASKLDIKVSVVTDNDGNLENIKNKYSKYMVNKNIKICYDNVVHEYEGSLNGYNNNTLEPCILRANDFSTISKILGRKFDSEDELLHYMEKNKANVALEIFESYTNIKYPKYIEEAISI